MFSTEFLQAYSKDLKNYRLFGWLRFTLISLGLIGFGYASGTPEPSQSIEKFGSMSFGLAVITFIVAITVQYFWRDRLEMKLWGEIIKTFPAGEYTPDLPAGGPIVLGGARGLSPNHLLKGTLDGLPIQLTDFESRHSLSQYTHGDNTQFTLRYITMTVPIGQATPHIFIDGKSQNRFSKRNTDLWSLAKKLNRKDRLQDLEGDFYKYFAVYTAQKKYLSALTILTPDTMLALRNKGYEFDYELYDGRLTVIHEANILDPKEFSAMIEAVQACLRELVPQITGHFYDDADFHVKPNLARMRRWAALYTLRILFTKLILICAAVFCGVALANLLSS